MREDAELWKRILEYMVRMKTGIEEINMKVYDKDDIATTIWLTENKKQSIVNPHSRSETGRFIIHRRDRGEYASDHDQTILL